MPTLASILNDQQTNNFVASPTISLLRGLQIADLELFIMLALDLLFIL